MAALAWSTGWFDEWAGRSVGLHEPARDGRLIFRVDTVECGFTRVGDPLVNRTAVGQFCVVELRIRNVGNHPITFPEQLQEAFGPSGQRYRPDSAAGLVANAGQQTFLNEVNPGNVVAGALVYDIPRDARIARLRLHQSARARGVTVRVA